MPLPIGQSPNRKELSPVPWRQWLELASHLEAFHQSDILRRRLDSLVALTQWLRAEDRSAATQNSDSEIPREWQRLALLIVLLERIPELPPQV
jgi:hypothetical protein